MGLGSRGRRARGTRGAADHPAGAPAVDLVRPAAAYDGLAPLDWLCAEIRAFLGEDSPADGLDAVLARLDQVTRVYESERIRDGELLWVEIVTTTDRVPTTVSWFRSLPHPAVLLGLGVANCHPGDLLEVVQHRRARRPSSTTHRWPFDMPTAIAATAPARG